MAAREKPKRSALMRFYRSSIKSYLPNSEPNKHLSYSLSTILDEERKELDGKMAMVEARKSVSHVESNLESVTSFLQVKVLVSDMPGFMQVHAFRCARKTYDSLEKFSSRNVAYNIKKEFDKVYGPAWHCIVGSSFGSYVTHSTGCFLYFSMDKSYILIFKTRVQRALG
ncbi:hypothetical protein K2173_011520 [Erythroxylum novogranatense]|uniref:Dynein light chain n=1 Tax=Erythroxylum novogranatense TaxID=1862640 RepID=A0AAV8TT96_9ROSI|nr:hypothetical protein K2173_011520 [Erythroxylum novogranatense]